jgi:hypothetical protein
MTANTGSRWNAFWQPASASTPEEVGKSPPLDTKSKSKTWQTTVSHVPSWPEEARTLKKHTWVSFLYTLGDVILVLLPIYFIRMCYLDPLLLILTLYSAWNSCHNTERQGC